MAPLPMKVYGHTVIIFFLSLSLRPSLPSFLYILWKKILLSPDPPNKIHSRGRGLEARKRKYRKKRTGEGGAREWKVGP